MSVKVLLVGICGYGESYLKPMLDAAAAEAAGARLAACADPAAARSPHLDAVRAAGAGVYSTLEEALAAGVRPDLTVVSSPIHLHCPHTCTALAAGSHVLCEKPLAASVAEVDEMRLARDRAGRLLGVGYQWSYNQKILHLRRDIAAGRFGAPRRLRTMVLWPRGLDYYARSSWAGKLRTADGRPIMDSPVNNATAHYLHNMFFVLGAGAVPGFRVAQVQAELYRANAIESFDTGCLRCRTGAGTEILFIASHSLTTLEGPVFEYQFAEASVTFRRGETIVARRPDGSLIEDYGNPDVLAGKSKLWQTVEDITTGNPPSCSLEAAAVHTRCVAAMHAACPDIRRMPENLVSTVEPNPGKPLVNVAGLDEVLRRCYTEWKLPAELGGVSWAVPGGNLELAE